MVLRMTRILPQKIVVLDVFKLIDEQEDSYSSEEICILESYNKSKAEKAEDVIRTQGNQTEPIEDKFSPHSLHLEYQYGDTSCGLVVFFH